jgi:hypothetical protein
MGTKNLKLGILTEPTILGGNVTVTVTGGDQTQTFSLAKFGNITIPTSLEGAQFVEIPVTTANYVGNTAQQFNTQTFNISVSGGNIAVAYWGTNYRRNYDTTPPTSTGVLYDYSIIVDTPLFDGQPDPDRMLVVKNQVGNVVTFTEGVGTAIINNGETFTADVDIDYYVPVQ